MLTGQSERPRRLLCVRRKLRDLGHRPRAKARHRGVGRQPKITDPGAWWRGHVGQTDPSDRSGHVERRLERPLERALAPLQRRVALRHEGVGVLSPQRRHRSDELARLDSLQAELGGGEENFGLGGLPELLQRGRHREQARQQSVDAIEPQILQPLFDGDLARRSRRRRREGRRGWLGRLGGVHREAAAAGDALAARSARQPRAHASARRVHLAAGAVRARILADVDERIVAAAAELVGRRREPRGVRRGRGAV